MFPAALQLLDLDLHQRAGGRGAAHHRVACRGPGKGKARIVGLAAHGVVTGAKGAAKDHRNFRHHGIGHRIHHLGAGADNAAPFRVGAHHESVDVVQKNQGNQILVAVHDEARRFLSRLGINHSAKLYPPFALVRDGLLMRLLVGHNPHREAADARVTAEQRFAVIRFVFVEAAAVHQARQNLFHVVRACGIGFVDPINLLSRIERRLGFLAIKGRGAPISQLFHQRADAYQATFIVGLAVVHRAADLRMHLGAAQIFGRYFLSYRRLHQRRSRQKKSAALSHQYVVAHQRQVGAAGHAHAHDGGDLRNAHGAHDCVIAEDAAKIVGVRENIFLQRQKHSGRVHQIKGRNPILDRDVLCPDDFF